MYSANRVDLATSFFKPMMDFVPKARLAAGYKNCSALSYAGEREKRLHFSNGSLYLSRACLGKPSVFMYQVCMICENSENSAVCCLCIMCSAHWTVRILVRRLWDGSG